MPKLRQFFEAMAEDCFYFNMLLIPFAFLLAAITGNIFAPVFLLCFLPLLVYHFAVRLCVKKFSHFLALSWVSCALGLFFGHHVVHTLFLAFLCSHSIKRRTNDSSKLVITFEGLCFPLFFLAVLYMTAGYLRVPFMRSFFHAQAMAIFLLALIYVHLCGINSELEFAAENSLQSTKQITNFANKYLAVYLLIFFVMLALFRLVPFGKAAAALWEMLASGIRYVLSFVKSKPGTSYVPESFTRVRDNGFDLSAEPAPLWAVIIETILMYIVNIIALGFLTVCIVLLILRLYYGFRGHKEVQLSYVDANSEVTALKPFKIKKKKVRIDDPIRRRFYKKVNVYFKKKKLYLSDTPLEIRDKLRGKEELDDLVGLYEKARYDR